MGVYRPLGVTIISILLIIAAALIIIGGTILVYAVLQSEYLNLSLSYWIGYELFITGGGDDFMLAGISGFLSGEQTDIYIWYGLFVCFLIYSGLSFPAGIGLFYMKNWGRYLALVVSIFSMILGVITIFWLVGLIPLGFGIGMLVYLVGDVKYEFQ